MDREFLWTSFVLGLMRSALSNASEVEMGAASGAVSPFAATLKGFGFKQVNVYSNHKSRLVLHARKKTGKNGRRRPLGARPATAIGRRAGGHRRPAAHAF